MKLWINGHFHESPEGLLSVQDRGFLLGDGLFETLRMEAGEPEFFAEHWARMDSSAKYFGLVIPYLKEQVHTTLCELSSQNELPEAAARITLSRGVGARGLAITGAEAATMLVTVTSLPNVLPEDVVSLGYAPDSRSTGGNEWSHKTLGMIHNVRALWNAQAQGFDDAIICDAQGYVLETSMANIFAITDGILLTPPTNGSILPGVMRKHVIRCAKELGISVQERALTQKELQEAQSVFLTNSLRGILPVCRVNNEKISTDLQILKILKHATIRLM